MSRAIEGRDRILEDSLQRRSRLEDKK